MQRVHAADAVGLHDHALHAAPVREVVDIGRAEIGRDGVVDVLEGDTEGAGLLALLVLALELPQHARAEHAFRQFGGDLLLQQLSQPGDVLQVVGEYLEQCHVAEAQTRSPVEG